MGAGNFRRTIPRARAGIPALPGVLLPGTLLRLAVFPHPLSASREQGRDPGLPITSKLLRAYFVTDEIYGSLYFYALYSNADSPFLSLPPLDLPLSPFCVFVARALCIGYTESSPAFDFRSYLRKFSSPQQCRTRVTRFLLLVGQWTVLAPDSFSRCLWSCARASATQSATFLESIPRHPLRVRATLLRVFQRQKKRKLGETSASDLVLEVPRTMQI